jgi:hypothetical protein
LDTFIIFSPNCRKLDVPLYTVEATTNPVAQYP